MINIILILATVLIVYYPVINYGLVVDDLYRWTRLKNGALRPKFWHNPLFWVKSRVYGAGTLYPSIKADHALSIVLHAVASLLIFYAFGADKISFGAAMLYAVNPINHQTAAWLNGRRYQMSVILLLTMMLFKPWGFVLYPAIGLFQVTAFFAPALLGKWGVLGMVAVSPLAWMMFKNKFKSRLKNIPDNCVREYSPRRVVIVIKTYGYYFFKMLFPGKVFLYDRFLYFWGARRSGTRRAYALNWDFWKGIVAGGITTAGLFFLKGNLFYLLLFMVLSMLQWCNIVTATMTVADRYMSVANVVMMYFVSYFISPVSIPVMMCVCMYYAVMMRQSMPQYANIEQMYRYHLYHAPDEPTSRSFYVTDLIKSGNFMHAWAIAQEGLKYCPNNFKFLFQSGVCASRMGDKKTALHFLNKSKHYLYVGEEEKLTKLIDDTIAKVTNAGHNS